MKKLLLVVFCCYLTSTTFSQDANTAAAPIVKERIIKIDFFAPMTGNLSFGYEQTLINSVTLDLNLGIIGIGFIENNSKPAGIFVKGGTKFYFTPDFLLEGMKRVNDFQGTYFKPQIIYSGFGFDYYSFQYPYGSSIDRGSNHSFSFLLNLGKQWVLAKTLSIEAYGGVGYGWSIVDIPDFGYYYGFYDESQVVPYKYSHVQPSNRIPFAAAAGFNIGLLVK